MTDEKLKVKCIKCEKEFELHLPDDTIFSKFKMLCKECSKDPETLNEFIGKVDICEVVENENIL